MTEKSKSLGVSPWVYGVLLVGIALRVTGLTVSALRYDEAFSLTAVRQGLFEMVSNLTMNISPPGWEILLWFVARIAGFTPLAARSVPLLASLATLWIVLRLTQELSVSSTHQVIALGLLASLPIQIWFGQDGRVYSIFACLYTLGILLAIQGHWLGLTAVMGLLLWCHNTAVFYVPTLGLIALLRHPRAWKSILLAGIVAGLSWIVWLPTEFHQAGTLIPFFPRFTVLHVVTNVEGAFFGGTLQEGWALFGLIAVSLSFVLALWNTLVQTRAWFRNHSLVELDPGTNPNLFLMAAVVVPIILFVGFSLVIQNVFIYRTLSVLVPACVIWFAPTIDFRLTRGRNLRLAHVILTALWAVVILAGLAGWSSNKAGNVKDIVTLIESDWRTGDIIYYAEGESAITFNYYLSDKPQYVMDDALAEALVRMLKLNSPVAALETISYQRAWVIGFRNEIPNERMANYVKNCQMVGDTFLWQSSQTIEIYVCRKA